MNVILSVHGMNSRTAGSESIDRLVNLLDVDFKDLDDMDYDMALLFKIWFFKRPSIERIAGGVKKWIDDDRIKNIFIVAHSNGLNFTLQALKLLKKRKQLGNKKIIVISLSGCANRRVNTDNAFQVHNWYTERDGWLLASKWLPSWTMGSFGRSHYRGKSKNVIDKDITKHISSHSEWFSGDNLNKAIIKTNELIKSYTPQ